MKRWIMVVSLAAPLLSGCKDEQLCERARLDLNKAWAELRSAATRRKLEGADLPTWQRVESNAELLESSFMTRQVTWSSAEKAGRELESKLPALRAAGDARLQGFAASAESALQRQRGFEKDCR